MNYVKHYNLLIEKARVISHDPGTYLERHHIIPKCLGGGNVAANIVSLTPEQHYVAHLLLVKMYPANKKLIYAAHCMRLCAPNQQRSNKTYGWVKRRYSEALTGTPRPWLRDKPRSSEIKQRISEALMGKKHSENHVQNSREARLGLPAWNKGKRYSWVSYPRTCPYCDYVATDKYHYDYHKHYYHGRRELKGYQRIAYPRQCPDCNYVAANCGTYHYHKNTRHPS